MVRRVDRRETLIGLAAIGLASGLPAGASESRAGAIPSALSRGFNLPDQAPLRAGASVATTDLKYLRARGMTHIRLPVVAEAVLPDFSGPAMLGATFDDLDHALERLIGLGFCVSVDMHPGDEFQALQRADPQRAHQALRLGWRGLSARLARWPTDRLLAELLNEPATSDDVWRPFAEELAQEVRTKLPATTLIVGPAPFQRIEALAQWRPFADPNIVYAVHYYDPMVFTHQGLTWDDGSPYAKLAGVPFPMALGDPTVAHLLQELSERADPAAAILREAAAKAWTPTTIMTQFTELANWSRAHSAPVVVNEFGVLRFKARPEDRLAWLASVRAAAEAVGFGWTYWSYAGGFGLVNESGALDRAVIDALLPHA